MRRFLAGFELGYSDWIERRLEGVFAEIEASVSEKVECMRREAGGSCKTKGYMRVLWS